MAPQSRLVLFVVSLTTLLSAGCGAAQEPRSAPPEQAEASIVIEGVLERHVVTRGAIEVPMSTRAAVTETADGTVIAASDPLPSSLADRLAPGDDVTITPVAAGRPAHGPATITAVGNDSITVTIPPEIELAERETVVLVGRTVATSPDTLSIARDAIHNLETGPWVIVETQDGATQRRSVSIGLVSENVVEVLGGVDEGDVVLGRAAP